MGSSIKNVLGALLLCTVQRLVPATRLVMGALTETASTSVTATGVGGIGGRQEVDGPSAADSLLSRRTWSSGTAISTESIWVVCAEQFQECVCKGPVRWGVPGNYIEVAGAKKDGWNRVKCEVPVLPDVAPGEERKHCLCGMPPDGVSLDSINPALLRGLGVARQPTISCEHINDGSEGDGAPGASLLKATSGFCNWESDEIPGANAMSHADMHRMMQAWVDLRFADNHRKLFDASGWAPRAFVNYYADFPHTCSETFPHGKYARMTEELIDSVHAFSAEPIVVFHFGTQTPDDWNAKRWPRLILFHAASLPADPWRSFHFNKMRAMLLARVHAGIMLDSDQFVAPGVDALFQRTEQEITKDYAMPIMPAHFLDRSPKDGGRYWSRYCPTKSDCRWQTARWGQTHPTWTYWALPWVGRWLRRKFRDEVLPPLKDKAMPALRLADVSEAEDLLNIATWEEGGTKQWCKYDLPGPNDFYQLLDRCKFNCSDVTADPRWHPRGVAKAFYTAHNPVNPDETKCLVEEIRAKQEQDVLPPPILYHGDFFSTGQEMKEKHPDAHCII